MLAGHLPLAEIRRCAADPAFLSAMAEIYEQLDADIAARKPVCTNRGLCCRFGEFGHRLFVTPAELAWFLATTDGDGAVSPTEDSCPYQRDGQCTARQGRPTGCRIFFCDPAAQEWQPGCSEDVLARLKTLHQRFDLPYAYLDWLAALSQLAAI